MAFSEKRIVSELRSYGVSADAVLAGKVAVYIELLLRWNKMVSLTSVVDDAEVLKFHFGESMFAVAQVGIGRGRLADIGSGAGFPGLAIKLACPETSVLLVEANHKKSVFLADVVRELGLEDVEIFRGRFEHLGNSEGRFEYVTSRAVCQKELPTWSADRVTADGKLLLWVGGEKAEEILRDTSLWKWSKTLVPGARSRFLLVGSREGVG